MGTASIAIEQVKPAMLKSTYGEVYAIASRNMDKARNTAERFPIPKSYGSYQGLLDDGQIDAVYIPLPNHLHVQWAIKALEAGKHVLVEKPIGLSSKEGRELLEASQKHPNLKVMEAFMYRHHPQWAKVKELIGSGVIS